VTEPPVKIETMEPNYPALVFMVRHGHWIAALCGVFVFLAGVWALLEGLIAPIGMVANIVAALVAYLLVRVLWDIARLVADTMIPK
jgi:hypothetical protein